MKKIDIYKDRIKTERREEEQSSGATEIDWPIKMKSVYLRLSKHRQLPILSYILRISISIFFALDHFFLNDFIFYLTLHPQLDSIVFSRLSSNTERTVQHHQVTSLVLQSRKFEPTYDCTVSEVWSTAPQNKIPPHLNKDLPLTQRHHPVLKRGQDHSQALLVPPHNQEKAGKSPLQALYVQQSQWHHWVGCSC